MSPLEQLAKDFGPGGEWEPCAATDGVPCEHPECDTARHVQEVLDQ